MKIVDLIEALVDAMTEMAAASIDGNGMTHAKKALSAARAALAAELTALLALERDRDDTDNGYITISNQGEEWSEKYIYDGFGDGWSAVCPKCGAPMVINRPGDCRCSAECYNEKDVK